MEDKLVDNKYKLSDWMHKGIAYLVHNVPQPEAFVFSNNKNGNTNPPICNCGHKFCPNPGVRDTEQTRLFAQKQMIDRARQEMYDHFNKPFAVV